MDKDRQDFETLLASVIDRGGSDLHLAAGSSPRIRIDGVLKPLDWPALTPEKSKELIFSVLSDVHKERFKDRTELDISFGIGGLGRFRANVYVQRGSVSASIRRIPHGMLSLEEAGLPHDALTPLLSKTSGLILVTGATGSGKSTTLAAMVDYINKHHEGGHIVTIEDPIEFVHSNDRCLVTQREVNTDTESFHDALRSSLRQDPDIVLIGEIRDKETIDSALTLSETGHLTFGTLHTSNAVQTVNRIIDMYPSTQQDQVRQQLSFTLRAVVSQMLLPLASGKGRVLATELMVAIPAIQALIRENKVHQIYSHIQTGRQFKMHTLNASLAELTHQGKISQQQAIENASDFHELERLLSRRPMP